MATAAGNNSFAIELPRLLFAAPTTEGSIFCVALDGSAGSGKTALRCAPRETYSIQVPNCWRREALFGQSFKEEKISNEIVKFTSNFARLVVYELQGACLVGGIIAPLRVRRRGGQQGSPHCAHRVDGRCEDSDPRVLVRMARTVLLSDLLILSKVSLRCIEPHGVHS